MPHNCDNIASKQHTFYPCIDLKIMPFEIKKSYDCICFKYFVTLCLSKRPVHYYGFKRPWFKVAFNLKALHWYRRILQIFDGRFFTVKVLIIILWSFLDYSFLDYSFLVYSFLDYSFLDYSFLDFSFLVYSFLDYSFLDYSFLDYSFLYWIFRFLSLYFVFEDEEWIINEVCRHWNFFLNFNSQITYKLSDWVRGIL